VLTLDRGVEPSAFGSAPWLLGGVKTLSYAVNMAAQREAARRGADDIIFVTSGGSVLEGPTSSVVWLADGVLRTVQPGANGILAGTTQQLLFDRAAAAGWQTELGTATVDDLHSAEMVWLIGSVRGAVDVVEIDGRPRPRRPDIDRTIRALCGF
jgi:4-amino-4-deoxychorismate lyase